MELKKYDLVFLSTFINKNTIALLIKSVLINNKSIMIHFVIVNQTNEVVLLTDNEFVDFCQINTERLSLSKARNIGVNYLLDNDIHFDHIMFPDDDSSFDSTFFSLYKQSVEKDTNYLIDVYCEGTTKLFKKNSYLDGACLKRFNYDAAMSVNMVVCYSSFIKTGKFDERLGVGARYGAGEDNDFFIRSCEWSHNGYIYQKSLYNFHPSNQNKFTKMKLNEIVSKYVNYGNGSIFMLCKHNMYRKALVICFRALGGIFVSISKLEFKLVIAFVIVFFSRLKMLFICMVRNSLNVN